MRDVDVFLFDEPLSNLDAKLRTELRVEIKRLHQRLDNTMIYVTHDQIEALTLADRIAVMKGGMIQQLDDPQTIYNQPANLFVAGFVGSPAMNFLTGEIGGRRPRLQRCRAAIVPLAGYDGGAAADGPKVILGVRPEHIRINADPRAGTSDPTPMVEMVEPMGADSLVWLKFEGQSLSARVESSVRFHPGDKVKVRFRVGLASVFDEADSDRI